MTGRRPPLALLLVLTAGLAVPPPAGAYLKLGFETADGRRITLRWSQLPVRYFITDRGVPGVTATQFQQAVDRAFATWQQVPSAAFTHEFAGFTGAQPFQDDNMSVIGFLDRPELERVLGATSFLVDTRTGEIVESDIFFNAQFAWSVSAQGEPGRFDVESIAVHEVGHLLGLGHSAIGETELQAGGGRRVIASEAVMFPIAFTAGSIADRTLKADDVAGVSDIYPASDFRRRTGSISGRVRLRGEGIFGAHVVAFNPRTQTLIGGFTVQENGNFVIAGLSPGPHVIRVEPLDDGEVESFFTRVDEVELDFRAMFLDRLVVVPEGGAARDVELAVMPK